MSKSLKWWTRKFHRWGAVLIVLPLIVVIVSGLLLQVKKQFAWIQPETLSGSTNSLSIKWEEILETTRAIPAANVNDWRDIDRLDVRPNNGLIKVRCKNGWELQIDTATSEILSSAYRRSDWIESIHDGSFFSDSVKLWVFLPNGFVLLLLWITGIYLWYIPIAAKRKHRSQNK